MSGTGMKTKPDFASWKCETLVRFAGEAYDHMVEQDRAIEQLRQDLKDSMKLLRETLDARKGH